MKICERVLKVTKQASGRFAISNQIKEIYMANIFLTRKCNLKCPYCFASEFVNKENEEVTLENFKKIVDFIKKNGTKRIGLIGDSTP